MSDSASTQPQLLHLVIGGELKDVTDFEFEDLSKIDFVVHFRITKQLTTLGRMLRSAQ